MAILRGNLSNLRGSIGNVRYTRGAGGRTIASEKPTEVTNPRTEAQMSRRVRWANLVNFYRVSKDWMPKCYENVQANQSIYNKFMSLNINENKVSLTKDQAAQGGVVAAPYIISQGTLPSIEVTALSNGAFATSLLLGDLTITAETTVAQFSEALLANNARVKKGMQLSFISYQQAVNNVSGVPYCVVGWYEVTIDTEDNSSLNDKLPMAFAAATVGTDVNYLGTGAELSAGAFAYILSERVNGKLRVSSQKLIMNNNQIYLSTITANAMEVAEYTYGVSGAVFLAPGYAGGSTKHPGSISIMGITAFVGDRSYSANTGEESFNLFELDSDSNLQIYLTNDLADGDVVAGVSLKTFDGRSYVPSSISKYTETVWSCTGFPVNMGGSLKSITIITSNGAQYDAEFKEKFISID